MIRILALSIVLVFISSCSSKSAHEKICSDAENKEFVDFAGAHAKKIRGHVSEISTLKKQYADSKIDAKLYSNKLEQLKIEAVASQKLAVSNMDSFLKAHPGCDDAEIRKLLAQISNLKIE